MDATACQSRLSTRHGEKERELTGQCGYTSSRIVDSVGQLKESTLSRVEGDVRDETAWIVARDVATE